MTGAFQRLVVGKELPEEATGFSFVATDTAAVLGIRMRSALAAETWLDSLPEAVSGSGALLAVEVQEDECEEP